MAHELTKAEKKITRELISKGVEKEFRMGILEMEAIINDWKENGRDDREIYHKLHDTIRDHRKHLARRYDDLRGSTYALVLSAMLADNIITVDDLQGMREETVEVLKRWSRIGE